MVNIYLAEKMLAARQEEIQKINRESWKQTPPVVVSILKFVESKSTVRQSTAACCA